jgi:hypothetical protein
MLGGVLPARLIAGRSDGPAMNGSFPPSSCPTHAAPTGRGRRLAVPAAATVEPTTATVEPAATVEAASPEGATAAEAPASEAAEGATAAKPAATKRAAGTE